MNVDTAPDVAPATHAGMGAILYEGGVAFRVWAPFADAVWVKGSFNDWNAEAHPLASEENGYWSADVDGAGPGDEYKFVLRNGEHTFDRVDPYARQVTNSVGNSVVYDPHAFDWGNDDFHMPDWNGIVIYELHVGTFGSTEEDRPANLYEAIDRLDYLVGLGVNAVELMPLTEFAGDLSWGYNPAHPFAVESSYGGPDALKTFVREAHARGLAVLLDVVYNHFGPSDLALWQYDGWSDNDKGGIYFYNDERSRTPWGDTRPDFGRDAVRSYILDNAAMWLDEYRMDGLRLDATPYVFSVDGEGGARIEEGWSLLQAVNQMIHERFVRKITIAEDLLNNPTITASPDDGGAGFDAQWDAAFVHPVRAALTAPADDARNLHDVRAAIEHRYNGDAFGRVIYTESHDEVANGKQRVAEEVWPANADSWASKKRAPLGVALVMTAPGIPMLFQGQEILEPGHFEDTRPVDWSRTDHFGGLYDLHRDLIRLRRNLDGTTRGLVGQHLDVYHVDDEGCVLAYHRWMDGGPGDDTVVVANLSANAYDAYGLPFPHPGFWRLRFNGDWDGYDPEFGNYPATDVEARGNDAPHAFVALAPYTVLVFSQDP